MKRITPFIVCFVLILSGIEAQQINQKQLLRQKISQVKLAKIQKELNLDEASLKAFRPIFFKYEREMESLKINRGSSLMKILKDSLSNEDADRLIRNDFINTRLITDIREKYYYEFKNVLTPVQIIKVYKTEADLQRTLMQEYKKRQDKKLKIADTVE